MIIAIGSFTVEPAERDVFIASRVETMQTSRGEPGCLEYTFAADPIDPGRVVLVERWETQEALDTHLAALRSRSASPSADVPPTVAPTGASLVFYTVASENKLI